MFGGLAPNPHFVQGLTIYISPDSAIPLLSITQEKQKHMSKRIRNMYNNVPNNLVCNNTQLETPDGKKRWIMVYSYSGIYTHIAGNNFIQNCTLKYQDF